MPRRTDSSDLYGGPTRADLLTRRQLEVVRAYVNSGGAKSAAKALGITPSSVVTTLERARSRADVDTTSQLLRELTKRGEL
jgi:DNA-binding CsgD family transcriptional regulator